MKIKLVYAAAVAGLLATGGAARAANCADVITSTPDLSQFSALMQQSGLAQQVATGTLTVFAPTNAALNHISSITQMLRGESSNAQPDFPKLQTLVRAHLVTGVHPQDQMHGKVTLATLAGTSLNIDGTGNRDIMLASKASGNVNLSGTRLNSNVHTVGATLSCDNGVIYPISNALVQ